MPFNNQPPEYIDEAPVEGVLSIPYERLSEDALFAIIEEFVSREGTDYGDYQYSFADKVEQVLAQIKKSKAVILFDPISQNCHIELSATVRPYLDE